MISGEDELYYNLKICISLFQNCTSKWLGYKELHRILKPPGVQIEQLLISGEFKNWRHLGLISRMQLIFKMSQFSKYQLNTVLLLIAFSAFISPFFQQQCPDLLKVSQSEPYGLGKINPTSGFRGRLWLIYGNTPGCGNSFEIGIFRPIILNSWPSIWMNKNLPASCSPFFVFLNWKQIHKHIASGSHPIPGRENLMRMKPVSRKTRSQAHYLSYWIILCLKPCICGLLSNVHQ